MINIFLLINKVIQQYMEGANPREVNRKDKSCFFLRKTPASRQGKKHKHP